MTDIWEDTVRDAQEGHRPAGQVSWISSNYAAKRGTNRYKHVQVGDNTGRRDGFPNDLRCHQAPGRKQRHAQLGHLK